jgi:hypothetical protein
MSELPVKCQAYGDDRSPLSNKHPRIEKNTLPSINVGQVFNGILDTPKSLSQLPIHLSRHPRASQKISITEQFRAPVIQS